MEIHHVWVYVMLQATTAILQTKKLDTWLIKYFISILKSLVQINLNVIKAFTEEQLNTHACT